MKLQLQSNRTLWDEEEPMDETAPLRVETRPAELQKQAPPAPS